MKKIIISLILTSLILLSCICYASTYKFTALADKTTVKPGDEILISLKVSDINAGSDGINVVETTLVYDKNVFDSFNFISKNDWKHTYNSNAGERFGKLLYTKMITGVTKDEEIGVLKFKLKDELNISETEIKLLQVTSNDGYELMNDGDKIIKLKIVKDIIPEEPKPEEPKPEEPKPEEPKPEEPQPEEPKPEEPKPEEPKPEEPKPEESKPEEPKPEEPDNKDDDTGTIMGVQTGDFVGIIFFILLITILINIIIFVYNKNKKSSSENTKKNK